MVPKTEKQNLDVVAIAEQYYKVSVLLYLSLCWNDAATDQHKEQMMDTLDGQLTIRDPERTRLAVDGEGWLHTGDIGEWQLNGTLKIIDRCAFCRNRSEHSR